MKRRSWMTVSIVLLLAGALFLLGSCVLAGTGTIHVRNNLTGGKQITALYIYPTGSADTSNEISEPLAYADLHIELGVELGPTTIHAVINSGAAAAEETVTVREGTIHSVWIVDSDILP